MEQRIPRPAAPSTSCARPQAGGGRAHPVEPSQAAAGRGGALASSRRGGLASRRPQILGTGRRAASPDRGSSRRGQARAIEAGKVTRLAMHNYEFPNTCFDPFLLDHLPSL